MKSLEYDFAKRGEVGGGRAGLGEIGAGREGLD
jgi:hypothetical protein